MRMTTNQKKNLPETKRRRIESSNIYESIEPLYFVTLFMGISPYLYNFTTKSAYVYSKLAILYSICMIIIVHGKYTFDFTLQLLVFQFKSIFLVVYFEQINVENDLFTDSITSLMDIVHIHYSNILSVIIIFMACWQRKCFILFMKKIDNIDHTFTQLGLTINHKKTKISICGKYIIFTLYAF